MAIALTLAFFIGVGIPVLFICFTPTGLILVGMGFFNLIFVTIAMLAAVYTRDKAKGIGMSILYGFTFHHFRWPCFIYSYYSSSRITL